MSKDHRHCGKAELNIRMIFSLGLDFERRGDAVVNYDANVRKIRFYSGSAGDSHNFG